MKPSVMLSPLAILTACAPEPIQFTGLSAEPHGAVATMLQARWSQDLDADASWLEFSADGGPWMASPSSARAAGTHEEWILGVPGDAEVAWRVVAEREGAEWASADQSARTDPLPDELPEPTLAALVEGETSPERWVLGSLDVDGGDAYTGPYRIFIADRDGRIVWYYDLEHWMSMFPRVARTGRYIAFDQRSFFDATGEHSVIRRMSLDGEYSEEIPAPGMGWTWDEMDDGSLLYDELLWGEGVTLQQVEPDGTRTEIWDCGAWLSAWDPELEHCNTNTVNWVAATDSVLWSTYWGDWIAEIDRASGEVLWHAGGGLPEGWTVEGDGLELQHYPNYTPDGTLIVSTHVPGVEGQQRAIEYEVDAAGQTLREVWSYGAGVEGYAKYSGEVVRLENGNALMNYGTGGEIREVTVEGETVWSLQWGEDWTLGHTQLIGDLYALNVGR